MKDKEKGKTVSATKLAANRNNAKRSTGPRTQKGKHRASLNSYKHGFYGMRLFPSRKQIDEDASDYNRIYRALWDHYSPVGDLEKLCVEKIAVESLRLARLLSHEQKVFAWGSPFEARSVDRIIRYESCVSRQLEKAIDRLERLQEERKAESDQFDPSEESDGEISDTDETHDVSASSNAPGATLTSPQQHPESSVKGSTAPVEEPQPNRPAETAGSNSKATVLSLSKLIEKAAGLTPSDDHENSLGSGENDGTDSAGGCRSVERLQNAELIERINCPEDLEWLDDLRDVDEGM